MNTNICHVSLNTAIRNTSTVGCIGFIIDTTYTTSDVTETIVDAITKTVRTRDEHSCYILNEFSMYTFSISELYGFYFSNICIIESDAETPIRNGKHTMFWFLDNFTNT